MILQIFLKQIYRMESLKNLYQKENEENDKEQKTISKYYH